MAIIQKQSMSAQVIDHILGQIESGELKPGDKLLNERDFAEQLGISRVPLREAMCALTALGILTTRQGDGTFVNHFNEGMLGRILYIYTILDEISSGDLMELRIALEAGTAAAAAARRTDEDLELEFGSCLHLLNNVFMPGSLLGAYRHMTHIIS